MRVAGPPIEHIRCRASAYINYITVISALGVDGPPRKPSLNNSVY